jgi:hypothetical protein
MLCACVFTGQTKAPVSHSSQSPPMVLVGCRIETGAPAAIDLTGNKALTGVSLVDCVIRMTRPGPVFATAGRENLLLDHCFVRGAAAVVSEGSKIPEPGGWTAIDRYAYSAANSVTHINGKLSAERESVRWRPGAAPDYAALRAKHWSRTPSWEDKDAVSVKSFGARGDGESDDTRAFQEAIAKHAKVFVPRGSYRLTAPLRLRAGTELFGLQRSISVLRFAGESEAPAITMPNDAAATVSVTFLSVGGLVEWTAGRGLLLMAPARLRVTGNGGGRFCGVTGIRQGFQVDGTRQPAAFYALNVERIRTNPQSEIRNARQVRIYYLKVEATPTGYGVGVAENTGNTPLAIVDSNDVRLYCVNGNVVTAEKRPMVDLVNSRQVLVSHAKSFKTGDFPQLRETFQGEVITVPSDRASALLIRE